MTDELVVTRHRAWLDILEAPARILVSLQALTNLDPDTAHLFGQTLVIQNGPDYEGGHVSYLIDGWNGYALTAHKVEDTRSEKRLPRTIELIDLEPKGAH